MGLNFAGRGVTAGLQSLFDEFDNCAVDVHREVTELRCRPPYYWIISAVKYKMRSLVVACLSEDQHEGEAGSSKNAATVNLQYKQSGRSNSRENSS
jgi:hypothetical protein